MKVKWDFVTNSSSCCYLLVTSGKITRKDLEEMGVTSINHFHFIKDKDELIAYTEGTGDPCDWVKRVTGPRRYWGMNEEWYKLAKPIVENGDHIVCVDIERNFDDVENFDGMGFDILDRYYD